MTRLPVPRYGIAEWYGQAFRDLNPGQRQVFARIALEPDATAPPCNASRGRPQTVWENR